ncbi:hypothetical protein BBJ29_008979 [Phytophthora kernoviae]|uniref:Uncharacterized protein n=1 Tax=Phytophthora kernoviae TaxID=325452 RepID=A0A3F2RDA3_9STRA|nr:hypothetical protein BBP00_00009249 [Phytophthora kernoviae]RLN63743.1 hypothetical protein BBJ29_008979 [Phytophthora kernoviae]
MGYPYSTVMVVTMAVATVGQEIFLVEAVVGHQKCELMDVLSSWQQVAVGLDRQTTAVPTVVAVVAWNRLRLGLLQMLRLFQSKRLETAQMW